MLHTQFDDVSFRLKEKHAFDWLKDHGRVFCVFDKQDSGNISFGVEKDDVKKFIKYAGARTINYKGKPVDAIERLKNSLPLYKELQHPHLIKFLNHFQVAKGYALVFDWFDGECLHSPWSFPPPEKYTNPESPFYRFRQLPIDLRLHSLKCIFDFHVHVEKNQFVAIDFYDGSILYDFKNHTTKICDIDFYKKKPFINTMGRLWGSSRFMSPEEFELGSEIDARANVFNMGSIAFGLLGGELDRSFTKWDAGQKLYEVALKAVKKERKERYASVEEFFQAWKSACNISLSL
ncbi:serine/threonine protein kinase [Neobacillus terrae]|uniref:serine/threonine protein kinase n=1 Tax=Neobacillus terrae TaxID=3034837 RepID=UPI00140CA652|nr:serine/threonine protein kinase [Neobacillus terrae]NHM31960.1 serine/threonine protein kinase [Neobacillus terrae]